MSFVSPRPSMFLEAKPRGTLASRGNKLTDPKGKSKFCFLETFKADEGK